MYKLVGLTAPCRPCPATALPLAMPQHCRLLASPPLTPAPRPKQLARASADEEGEFDAVYAEAEVEDEEYDNDDLADSGVRLYLDTADVAQWQRWAETGLFCGFTCNPTILRRDGVQCTVASMRQLARQAADLEVEELQLQAWGSSMADLYACGLDLYELDPCVVVKVPATLEGIKATRRLIDDGVTVTLTGVYSTHQVVTALAAGVSYVAPYLGRMNDAGKNGLEEIAKMQSIVDMSSNYEGEMRLLVASIRSADEIAALAAEGCNTFTISPEVARQLMEEPLTLAAAEAFQKDAMVMGAGTSQ